MQDWQRYRQHRRERRGHSYGPWAWEARFFQRGEVVLALLSLLEAGPKHGYELMKEMEQRSGGTYRASAGTIYPKLQQLQDDGLVTSCCEGGGKRVYQLTEAGRRNIELEAEAIARIWSRAELEEWGNWGDTSDAAELLRPVFRLMKASLRSVQHSDGNPDRIERVRAVLEKARAEIEGMC